jgi:hypothetical protein
MPTDPRPAPPEMTEGAPSPNSFPGKPAYRYDRRCRACERSLGFVECFSPQLRKEDYRLNGYCKACAQPVLAEMAKQAFEARVKERTDKEAA